jgi:hypothetical protein
VRIERNAVSFVAEFHVSMDRSRAVSSKFLKAAKKHFDENGVVVVNLSARPQK